MKQPTFPALLSLNAGFIDTAGFLALHGLFTAHVTGNFVTFGAAVALGRTGIAAKLLALPVFCAIIIATRVASYRLQAAHVPVLRTMLGLKLILLAFGAFLAIFYGPFTIGDSWSELVTGMVLVSAMAIQNAAHRIHLASAPPTTLMTGTTTQIMIDLADLIHGVSSEPAATLKSRLERMSLSVAAFALGCGAAALGYIFAGMWCFAVPPVLGFIALVVRPASAEVIPK